MSILTSLTGVWISLVVSCEGRKKLFLFLELDRRQQQRKKRARFGAQGMTKNVPVLEPFLFGKLNVQK